MRKILALLLLALVVVTGCSSKTGYDQTGSTADKGSTDTQVSGDPLVQESGTELEEFETVSQDMDSSGLDELEADTENFDW